MVRNLFRAVFDIVHNTDVQKTIDTVSEGVSLRGYNFWILICSIVLASIGLDVNSAAVIIGAMLISPLMSPILGVGLSLGINDRDLFLRSLRNLTVATFIGLLASTTYFLLTPFGGITSELLARTKPTLLDILVAFFGGVAGIVSISRSESTNAIPGVAIATALMPPLCTAGYGIASANWNFFLGAFYLYFINAIFISLATYLIVKYIKFPIHAYVDEKTQRKYARISAVLIVLVVLPSIYFLYTVYRDVKTRDTIEAIMVQQIETDNNEVLKWEIAPAGDSFVYVKVYYSGNQISEDKIRKVNNMYAAEGLDDYRLKALRVNLTKEEITGLSLEAAKQMMNQWQIEMAEKEKQQDSVENSWRNKALEAANEIRLLFPQIDSIYIGREILIIDTFSNDTVTKMWYRQTADIGSEDRNRLLAFLKVRLHADSVAMQKLQTAE